MSGQNADHSADNGELPRPPSRQTLLDDRIVDWLLKHQIRGLRKDDHHGLVTTREAGQAVGLSKVEARPVLERLATAGRIRKDLFHGGDFRWRSINPLPWEPEGKWPPGCVLDRAAPPDTEAAILRDLAALKTNAPALVQSLIERARAII